MRDCSDPRLVESFLPEIQRGIEKYKTAVIEDLEIILKSPSHPLLLNYSLMLGYPGLAYALAIEHSRSSIGNTLTLKLPVPSDAIGVCDVY